MDTKTVAEKLAITPRRLRQFLRSGYSTFVPVGSGARYEFEDKELPTLQKRYNDWEGDGKPRPIPSAKPTASKQKARSTKRSKQQLADAQVWAEEGSVELPDIRDPQIRKRALADARAAEDRLMLQLMAVGLHVTQLGDQNK